MSSWEAGVSVVLAEALGDFVMMGGAPGGVVAFGHADGPTHVVSAGLVAPECGTAPPDGGTRYDVASLTKVIATWPLAGFAVEGGLDLDEPVQSYLPALPRGVHLPGAIVTCRQLLAHTSGLIRPTRLDRYRGSDRPLAELILSEPLQHPPGTTHHYISRGYVLLGLMLPTVLGSSFASLASTLVWSAAGMPSTTFAPVSRTPRVAPTEQYFAGAPRIWGEAHDDSARLLGGVAGHAGAFSSASDLAAFARWLLSPSCPLAGWFAISCEPQIPVPLRDPSLPATEGQPVGTGLSRGLGWLLTSDGVAYHDGFTGVSLYLLPSRGRYLAVCTNAIYSGRARPGLRSLRERALAALVL